MTSRKLIRPGSNPGGNIGTTAMKRSVLLLTIGLLWSTLAHGRVDESQRHGKEMLQKMCARCHAVGKTGASPTKLAPPFRSF